MSNTKEISEKEAIEAARSLKMFCDKRIRLNGNCNCPFADGTHCNIGDVTPHRYEIPCRWTEEDYNLAKLLKSKGVKTVKRSDDESLNNPVRWLISNRLNELNGGWIPHGFFESLDIGEEICIDDVIKEYETSKNIFYI